jgi:hypothetical protein
VRLDVEIKKSVPDGTTASVVLLKRAPDGARRRRCPAACVAVPEAAART